METRYPTPYFSSLKVVLNDGQITVAVKDQQGRDQMALAPEKAQIRTHLTGWLNGQVVRSDEFSFASQAATGPKMEDLIAKAESMGVDVVATLNEAFDAIADLFPQTAQQPSGAEAAGPPIYFRPDAFSSNMHPTTKKSITIKVGVYSREDCSPESLQTYLQLAFEDGETKREREANIAQLQETVTQVQANLTSLDALITLKQAGTAIPAGQYNDHLVSQSVAELQRARTATAQELTMRIKQVEQLQQVLNKPLSTLVGDTTPLQKKFMSCVVSLCTSILMTLKESNPDYASIDVASIMAKFAAPDIA